MHCFYISQCTVSTIRSLLYTAHKRMTVLFEMPHTIGNRTSRQLPNCSYLPAIKVICRKTLGALLNNSCFCTKRETWSPYFQLPVITHENGAIECRTNEVWSAFSWHQLSVCFSVNEHRTRCSCCYHIYWVKHAYNISIDVAKYVFRHATIRNYSSSIYYVHWWNIMKKPFLQVHSCYVLIAMVPPL